MNFGSSSKPKVCFDQKLDKETPPKLQSIHERH